MKIEDIILTCINEHPGISAKKIVSCLNSKTNNLLETEETIRQAFIFKQLRNLKRKGSLHNRGDRWYFMYAIIK
ncbi:hypothetical protein IFT92_27510 [Peribacillus simplex]|uniref:hypothetical protein n=1 Tax=Peribacillus simplex TaxID=1478 RepID=UPI001922CC80|nr:hypothetical protein [Peribacillus simplex]MBD8591478.1 hypothetical protein [Peribacillus simplex]